MLGIKLSKNCNDDTKELYDKYRIMREMDRIKLHAKYICFIAVAILVWLISTGTYNNEFFPEWVSFASTITSIILSVLAIIMSITGESKTESLKIQLNASMDKMEEVTVEMAETQRNIKRSNEEMKERIDSFEDAMKVFSKQLNDLPTKTAEEVKHVFKSADNHSTDVMEDSTWQKIKKE